MCLAVPGKVISIDSSTEPIMGKVNFGGVIKNICLDWTPEVTIGEYVIVHVGFAISRMDEAEAMQTLDILRQLDDLDPEKPR